jgi:Uncharacterized conserved protein (DUF2039)
MSSSTTKTTKTSKKKGPVPAHQNATAWRHNPKSKTTAKIMASPIAGVCRRCRQKLEWRKQYRKYKPRTVLGTCNLCQKKNVHAAYHTICASCSTSNATVLQRLREMAEAAQNEGKANANAAANAAVYRQICCICVKEPSLEGNGGKGDGGGNGNEDGIDGTSSTGAAAAGPSGGGTSRPLRLRQLKTLERQQMEKTGRSRSGRPRPRRESESDSDSDSGSSDDVDVDVDVDNDDVVYRGDDQSDAGPDNADGDTDEEEEMDPFLRAVGGKDNLLVGEAYQQKLLKLQLQDESSDMKSPT